MTSIEFIALLHSFCFEVEYYKRSFHNTICETNHNHSPLFMLAKLCYDFRNVTHLNR